MTERKTDPAASRPDIPGYGVPESDDGLLPWSHVVSRLADAKNYWVTTSGEDGRPHAVPVWAVWTGGVLYFSVGPRSARNLEKNPAVSIHLEDGTQAVIIEGTTAMIHDPDSALAKALDDGFAAKYDWRPSENGEDAVGEGMYELRPTAAYAWTSFPADATRWRW
jgi:nitroimidazol reductase NimA-like FMN-containing flavoprotein (pyridoxamine 5'-phosphate oxidase superfamily)